jgi:hypothetical protein
MREDSRQPQRRCRPELTVVNTFGGERTKLNGRLDAVKYTHPQVWLVIEKGDGATPSQGHVIDHLGWAVPDVDAKISDLASKA